MNMQILGSLRTMVHAIASRVEITGLLLSDAASTNLQEEGKDDILFLGDEGKRARVRGPCDWRPALLLLL